MIQDNVRS